MTVLGEFETEWLGWDPPPPDEEEEEEEEGGWWRLIFDEPNPDEEAG